MKYEDLVKKIELSSNGKWAIFAYKDEPISGDFSKFENRLYVKKETPSYQVEISNSEIWDNYYIIKFDTTVIDSEFIEKIYEHHIKLILNGKAKTFVEALKNTFEYFANAFTEKMENTLWGDIGEAIFILKTYEYTGRNVIDNIHIQDNGLYDFSFKNGKFIEIKTTSPDKNEIILSNCQIDYVNDRDFIVVKFKKIENAQTIIDIYNIITEKIGTLCPNLKEKYFNYKNYECIHHFSINLDNIEIAILNSECIPQVEIKNNSALKKSKFYIDVTDGISSFENYITKVNLD